MFVHQTCLVHIMNTTCWIGLGTGINPQSTAEGLLITKLAQRENQWAQKLDRCWNWDLLLLLHLNPTFMWGRCMMTYASM